MLKRLFLIIVAIFLMATTVRAGEAVYYEGQVWDAFTSQSVTGAAGGTWTNITSGAHALYHDTQYGIYIKCSAATGTAGLAYQISPTATASDFVYPTAISWVSDTVNSTTAKYINFEPEVDTMYVRFVFWPFSGDADLTCSVKLYEQ